MEQKWNIVADTGLDTLYHHYSLIFLQREIMDGPKALKYHY